MSSCPIVHQNLFGVHFFSAMHIIMQSLISSNHLSFFSGLWNLNQMIHHNWKVKLNTAETISRRGKKRITPANSIRETHHGLWCLLYPFHKISCTESIILLGRSIQTCSLSAQTRTRWYDACRWKCRKGLVQTTHLFQATHKVVADRRPR